MKNLSITIHWIANENLNKFSFSSIRLLLSRRVGKIKQLDPIKNYYHFILSFRRELLEALSGFSVERKLT